jgi:tetratricopeptide (TPR) repeat protein
LGTGTCSPLYTGADEGIDQCDQGRGTCPGTIRKILRAKEGVDPESIRCLFTTFGLQLHEADLAASARLQVQADANFVGREGAIADLNTLVNRGAKVIVIQARGGVGKTTLARKYLQQEFGSFLEFPIAKETKDIASIESLIEEKLRQLGEEPGREFFVSLDRLKRKLQDERIGILIDNLEPALDSTGKFIEPHRRYVELLRVLTDPAVQSVTFITSRERLREASITVEHYMLKSLDIEAWEQFFQSRNLAIDAPAFAALHNAYGGNAKAMDIIRGAILEDYAGDVAAYWQANQHDLFIERDLEDLVTQQFDRLRQIDADAYNLLCRMGCYRYQDVPTVPIEGLLCLLWDVPENRQRRVVRALQDRSLVEFENGLYWLHPVIRGDAIERLRRNKDWEIANRNAAEFWTGSVEIVKTVNDILEAFEAYYHYFEIKDFENSGEILLRERSINSKEIRVRFGRIFHRFNLHQQLVSAINSIIDKVDSEYYMAGLYDMLSIIYRTTGNLHEAIEFSKKALKLTRNRLKSSEYRFDSLTPSFLEINSLIHIGICKIELFELEDALEIFEEMNQSIEKNQDETLKSTIDVILIFLYSFKNKTQINNSIDETFNEIVNNFSPVISHRYLGKGHRLIYLGIAYKNIGKGDKALSAYSEAIANIEELQHSVLKARLISCIAEIFGMKRNFQDALKNHLNAVNILSKIGAKCYLAQAYYQLGLTYQIMDEVEKSNESFQEAIQLFSEIKAPKQVERVRRSMEPGIEQR